MAWLKSSYCKSRRCTKIVVGCLPLSCRSRDGVLKSCWRGSLVRVANRLGLRPSSLGLEKSICSSNRTFSWGGSVFILSASISASLFWSLPLTSYWVLSTPRALGGCSYKTLLTTPPTIPPAARAGTFIDIVFNALVTPLFTLAFHGLTGTFGSGLVGPLGPNI